jgi:hypothetical protein
VEEVPEAAADLVGSGNQWRTARDGNGQRVPVTAKPSAQAATTKRAEAMAHSRKEVKQQRLEQAPLLKDDWAQLFCGACGRRGATMRPR